MAGLFTIDTHLSIPHDQKDLIERLRRHYSRPNPKYTTAKRMGFATAGIAPRIDLYEDTPEAFRFPREAVQELESDAEIENLTTLGEPAAFGKAITLRTHQVEPVDRMIAELERFKGGVMQCPPGWGKTVAALEIARRMGRKTAVLVHTSFLMTQWRDRIEQFLGISAGIVHQDVCDTDHAIVLIMAQTLNAREYPQDFFTQFGLVITDEAHRFSADTFQAAIVKFPATYRLGVTATPERKDELEWIFYAHIGPVAVVGTVDREDPEVYIIPSALGPVREPKNHTGRPDFVATITLLTESHARNRQIVERVVDAAKHDRRVIVFSDRRLHLEDLGELFERRCQEEGVNATFGFFVGGMTEAQRAMSSERQVIFSTYQFAKEGLDIAELDTCVLATPKGDIIQTVGRIQRVLPGKPHPVVLDFVDEGIGVCQGLMGRRLRQYRSEGWTIQDWRD